MKLTIYYFKVYNSVAISTFTVLGKHHSYLLPRHFHHARRKPCTIKQLLPIHPASKPLANMSLLSVSIELAILDVSYKWNHTICHLLFLASFT